MKFDCKLCNNVKNKSNFMEVILPDGGTHLFNKNCPTHGFILLEDLPMVEERRREWFTKRQLSILANRLIKPELIEVNNNNQMGLIEFSQWRMMTEDEKNEHYRTETEAHSGHD